METSYFEMHVKCCVDQTTSLELLVGVIVPVEDSGRSRAVVRDRDWVVLFHPIVASFF